ncbi:hypothetical protein [Salinispora fenicalii]|uniref:hypothetical protein n=1 Tax=Salinispora fenicalii TaxID=1137263 RepID=UPI0004AFD11A|nr:hypothetical protein [Salinispora fenicalii]
MTTQAVTPPTDEERAFVEEVAQYYYDNDGMPHDRGRVVGWLMICDPPRQAASQIVAALGVSREEVDRIVDQLTPDGDPVSVFERDGKLDEEDYVVWLRENSWGPKVMGIFAEFDDFHRVAAAGLDALRDEPEQRLRRLRNLERFLRFVSAEMPKILSRHEQRVAAGGRG